MAACSCSPPGSIRSRARSRFRSRRTSSPSSSPERNSAAMAPKGKNSDQALIELFLDMVAAERGGAKNTLAAYACDLADLREELGRRHHTIAKASTDDLR